MPAKLDPHEVGDLDNAMMALGIIGDKTSIEFLTKLVGEKYWLSRPERPVTRIKNDF